MSYTITANTAGRFTTNAEFQSWGSWISNAIANTGLTKATDSNQINWATVSAPVGTYTMQGYEIWGFSDALQSTAPVWMKLQYGSYSGNTIPALQWALGSGYYTGDGGLIQGSITGFPLRDYNLVNNFMMLAQAGLFANNTLVSYVAGGSNWLILALGARGTGSGINYAQFLSLERTVDANGTPTGDGVMATWRAAGASPATGQAVWSPIIGQIGQTTTAGDGYGVLHPERGGGVSGSNTAVYPIFHDWGGGPFLNPGLNLLAYMGTEFTAGTSNTFTYYGASHTYMPLGNSAIHSFGGRSANTSIALMMRWE
jgi:hypothetical protein